MVRVGRIRRRGVGDTRFLWGEKCPVGEEKGAWLGNIFLLFINSHLNANEYDYEDQLSLMSLICDINAV